MSFQKHEIISRAGNRLTPAVIAFAIVFLLLQSASFASALSLKWSRPTTYTDGSALTSIAGYKVYYGTASKRYTSVIDVGNVTTFTMPTLQLGTYYLAVSVYDAFGAESALSNEVIKTSGSGVAPSYSLGVFLDGVWYLDTDNDGSWTAPPYDKFISNFRTGIEGEFPVTGDWNRTGTVKVGIYVDGGYWYLDLNGNGVWDGERIDKVLRFGFAGATPVVGDWNNSGATKIGVYADGYWYLDMNGNGVWDGEPADKLLHFGFAGATPVTGDWNNSGTTKIGVYADGYWYLDLNGNGAWDGEPSDELLLFGFAGATPVTGDWNNSGATKIGVYADGYWYLDMNGNGTWEGSQTDLAVHFGFTGAVPIIK